MKKIFTIIFLLFIVNMFSINIDYDDEKNENIVYLETKITEIFSNDINTYHTIKLENSIYENQKIKISRGPIREINIEDNFLKIFTYTPTKLNIEKNKIIIKGNINLDFSEINFQNLLLKDAIKLFLDKLDYNWLNAEEIPDVMLSLRFNEINFENFLRILEEVYGLKTIFYTDKNLIITKKEELFETNLPLEFKKNENKKENQKILIDENIQNKKILIIESDKDIKNLDKLFDIKVINFDNIFVVEINKSDEEKFLSIIEKIEQKKSKYENNITKVTNEVNNKAKSDEIYTILKSKFDMIFLEDFFDLKYHKIDDESYLIYSDENVSNQVKELNELINTINVYEKIPQKKLQEKVLKTNLFVINSKNIELFGKICNERKIEFKIIENLENKNYVLVKTNEEDFDILKKLIDDKEMANKISIKDLITELASFENINVLIDFEDFIISFNNFDLNFSDILSFISSKGILYTKINDNTYRFFENKKILKYKLTIMAGDSLENKDIKDLYTILEGNIDVFNNIKNSQNNTYIITKPEISVIEGEFGELNSVLTIPVIEEKDGKNQIIDTIESGVKLKIKGMYNRDTNLIETNIELLLSEFSDESKKEETGYSMNRRSLITTLKMRNGSTIKAGNMNFSKLIEKTEGLSLLKNIPVFGKLFYNKESKMRNYNIIIFLNIKIENEAEDIIL